MLALFFKNTGMLLPGLDNFLFVSSWATSAGALFVNANSGRQAIRHLCRITGRTMQSAIYSKIGRFKKMNILALIGSDRKNGNTDRVIRMIEAQLQSLAKDLKIQIEFVSLYIGDFHIAPCRGCRVCFEQGEEACPLKDDIPLIKAKMDVADALLIASPVYVNDVSGLVKNWMDRLAYLCHRPAMFGKCAYSIVTIGGGSFRHAQRTMNAALLTWGYHLAGQTGFKMGALTPTDQLFAYKNEVIKSAEKLFQSVRKKAPFSPSFYSLLAFRVQQLAWQNEKPGTLDYDYWQSRDWFEPNCSFYFNHDSGKLKVTLARLAGALLYRFVV